MTATGQPESRYWTAADGLRLHAFDHAGGSGPARLPVLCVHGLTRNARDFGALAPWLAARARRVLAVDVRGRGRSDRDPRADYRLPTYAEDLLRLMDALGIERAVFIGTSMGGLITMELASRAPDRVEAAVINDIGPELDAAGLARIADYVAAAPVFASWADAADHVRRQNAAALPHYGPADWDQMARRMFEEAGGAIAAAYDPAISRAFGEAPLGQDVLGRWRALAADRPVLLIRGALSDLLSAAAAERLAAPANVTLVEVPGVGHAPMLDEPAALAAIEAFLDTVR